MFSEELLARTRAIREAYKALEVKYHGKEWSVEEDLLALGNDIGNLNRLVMTRQGRYYDETPYVLEQKLAENIWWLLELSQRLEIDISSEMENFLAEREEKLSLSTSQDKKRRK